MGWGGQWTVGWKGEASRQRGVPPGLIRRKELGSPPSPPTREKEQSHTTLDLESLVINRMASKPQHQGAPRGAPFSSLPTSNTQLLKQTEPSSKPNFWFVWPKSAAATSHRGRKPTEELNSNRVFACPFRTWRREGTEGKSEEGEARLPHSTPASPPAPGPHPAAVMGDLDGSRCGPVEGQLFPVGPLEADGVPVVARSFVQPRCRVLAGVGEPLVGGGAQQLQEGQLDHVHGGAISIHIGELRGGPGRGRGFISRRSC